jgi:hypothetical protein
MRYTKTHIALNIVFLFTVFLIAGKELYKSISEGRRIDGELKKEYDTLMTQVKVNGIVLSTYFPENWRGWQDCQYIKLKSGENYEIKIRSNLGDHDIYFGEIIGVGAVLRKNAGSDTLHVLVEDKEYQYIVFGY